MIKMILFYIWHFRHSFGFVKFEDYEVFCLKCGRSTKPSAQLANDLYRHLEDLHKQEQTTLQDIKALEHDLRMVLNDRKDIVQAIDALIIRTRELDELSEYFNGLMRLSKKEARRLNAKIVHHKKELHQNNPTIIEPEDDYIPEVVHEVVKREEVVVSDIVQLLRQPGRYGLISNDSSSDTYIYTYTDIHPPHELLLAQGWKWYSGAGYTDPNGNIAGAYFDAELVAYPDWRA